MVTVTVPVAGMSVVEGGETGLAGVPEAGYAQATVSPAAPSVVVDAGEVKVIEGVSGPLTAGVLGEGVDGELEQLARPARHAMTPTTTNFFRPDIDYLLARLKPW